MRTKFSRWQIVSFLSFTFFVILVSIPLVALAQLSGEVYVYSFPEFSSSEMLLDYFSNKSDWRVANYDLTDANYSVEFLKIVYILAGLGVEVVPPGICTSCELFYHTWDEIYQMYAAVLVTGYTYHWIPCLISALIRIFTMKPVWEKTPRSNDRSIGRLE